MTRRDPYQTAVRWVLAVAVVWFFVRPALADGPPMDGPYDYDPVCAHYTCAAECSGRADLGGCYRACQNDMQKKDCSPCCEEPARPPKPAPKKEGKR